MEYPTHQYAIVTSSCPRRICEDDTRTTAVAPIVSASPFSLPVCPVCAMLLTAMAKRRPYTISEASKRLGITPESILAAVRKGRIRGEKKTVLLPRTIWYLAAESVEAYQVSSSHKERGLKKSLDSLYMTKLLLGSFSSKQSRDMRRRKQK